MSERKNPFLDQKRPGAKETTLRVLGWSALASVAAASYHSVGESMTRITPGLGYSPALGEAILQTYDTLGAVSPAVMATSAAGYAGLEFYSRRNKTLQSAMRLSHIDYSGASTKFDTDTLGTGLFGRLRKTKQLAAPLALPMASTAFIAASMSIATEVNQGPQRPVDTVLDTLAGDDEAGTPASTRIVVDYPGAHFMNDSALVSADVERFAATVSAADTSVRVVPFHKNLPIITKSGKDQSALALSVPGRVFEQVAGADYSFANCEDAAAAIDESAGYSAGENVLINGFTIEVAPGLEGASGINRPQILMSHEVMESCIKKDEDSPYFGVIVSGAGEGQIREAMDSANMQNDAVISVDQFKDNNVEFWEQNSKPNVLQIIGYLGGFGAVALLNSRKAALLSGVKQLGMMRGMNITGKKLGLIETMRNLRTSLAASAVAYPLTLPLSAFLNTSQIGFKSGASFKEIAAGFTVTTAAMMYGSWRAINKVSKEATPKRAME